MGEDGLDERPADFVDVLGLGGRARSVAELRLRGLSRKQVAAALGVHVSTVHTHIRRTARIVGDESLLTLVNAVFRRVRERDRKVKASSRSRRDA